MPEEIVNWNLDEPLLRWKAERAAYSELRCEPIRFDHMDSWTFKEGALVHKSGGFFSVVGACFTQQDGSQLRQPLILQPEVGLLGFLLRRVNGGIEVLLQAKAEPGNIGAVQLAPTVQATISNYKRLHGGGGTPYLTWFSRTSQTIVNDSVQSEQGSRFLDKYNRNMTVILQDAGPDPVSDSWRWWSLPTVLRTLACDYLVNTDARSVLVCTDWQQLSGSEQPFENRGEDCDFVDKLNRSFFCDEADAEKLLCDIEDDVSALTRQKSGQIEFESLSQMEGWSIGDEEIVDQRSQLFSVAAHRISVRGREVPAWDQPLVRDSRCEYVTLVAQVRHGILHFLLGIETAIGSQYAQLGPVFQHADRVELEAFLLQAGIESRDVVFQLTCKQSDEGGRFYHRKVKYKIIEIDERVQIIAPPSSSWMTLQQIHKLLQQNGMITNECRSVLSLLLTYL